MILLGKNKVFREISVFQRSQKDQEKTVIKPFQNDTRTMKNQDKKRSDFFNSIISHFGVDLRGPGPPKSAVLLAAPGVLDQLGI